MELAVLALLRASNYVLIAVGFALVFGSLRILNLMHGSFVMLGAYGAYFFIAALTEGTVAGPSHRARFKHLKLASWPSSRKVSLREASSERGGTSLTALTAEQELKLYLLAHGVSIDPEAERVWSERYQGLMSLSEYASTSGICLYTANGCYINVPFVESFTQASGLD